MTTSSGDDSPFEVRGGLHLHDVNGEIFLEFATLRIGYVWIAATRWPLYESLRWSTRLLVRQSVKHIKVESWELCKTDTVGVPIL